MQKCLKYGGKRPQSGAMRKIMNPARPLKIPTRRKNLQPMPAIFRSDQRHFKIANCHATQTFFLTQHIKMILFINFVRVLGDEKGSLPNRRNKTLLTDVKLRLQRRLRKGIPLTRSRLLNYYRLLLLQIGERRGATGTTGPWQGLS